MSDLATVRVLDASLCTVPQQTVDAACAFIAAGSGVLMSECGSWDADVVGRSGGYGTKQDAFDFNQRPLGLAGDAAVMVAQAACINRFGDARVSVRTGRL